MINIIYLLAIVSIFRIILTFNIKRKGDSVQKGSVLVNLNIVLSVLYYGLFAYFLYETIPTFYKILKLALDII